MSIVDKAKNAAEKLVGEAKETIGDITNNDELKAEGQKDQAKATVKDGVEDVKDAASNAKDAVKDAFKK